MSERRQPLTPPIPRLFSQALAASYLGVSERTFEKWWRVGTMPAPHRFGRRLLWDRKLLDEWADALSRIGASEPNDFGD